MRKSNLFLGFRFLPILLPILLFATLMPTLQGEAKASSQPYLSDHGINFAIGNKYLVETDLSIQGPNAILDFKRTYNSTSTVNGILGYGWSCSFTDRLEIDGSSITRVLSTGRHIAYDEDGNGGWLTQQGKRNTIAGITGGYELTKSNGDINTYDSQGRLTQVQFLNGYTKTYSYTGDQLTSISDNFGKTLTFGYNTEGKLVTLSGPTGDFAYSYLNDNLVSVTKPDTTTKYYLYTDVNDTHNLTGIDDEAGVQIVSVTYDNQDRVISSSLAGHKSVTIEYPSSLSRIITDDGNNQTTYELEVLNGVVKVTSSSGPGCSSCGNSETNSSYTYTARQQVESVTNGRNYTTSYTYDANGDRATMTEAVGTPVERTITYSHNLTTNLLETISRDSVSNPGQQYITSLNYDANGNLLSRTENGFNGTTPITRTTTFTYNSDSQLETIDGPRTDVLDVTLLNYYPNAPEEGLNRGYLHTITNALGQVVTYSNYNDLGKPESILDANLVLTTLVYDSEGRLTSRTTGARVTSYQYDDAGRIDLITRPGNRILDYQYSLTGHLEKILDSDNNYLKFEYDPVSGKISKGTIHTADNSLKAELSYEYDSYGRLYREVNPDTDNSFTERGYDDVGNQVSLINELGQETTYGFDELDRINSIIQPGTVTTGVSYDSHDNQIAVVDDNNVTTTFNYDDFGQKTSESSPDRGITLYYYDEAGNLTSRTDGNLITTSYEYDALNRLLSKSYPQSENDVTYLYDQGLYGIGKHTGMTDSTGVSTYSYNQYGEVSSQTRTTDGHNVTIEYVYNDNGELASVTYPSGRIISYNRNADGYITGVTEAYDAVSATIADNIAYAPFGPLTAIHFGNGLQLSKSYDLQYRLTETSAGTVFDRSYTYLNTGLVETITDNITPANSQTFGYNDLQMLTSASGAYGAFAYTLDGVGNRLTKSVDGVAEPYSYLTGSNRLDQVGNTSPIQFIYDDAGNTTTKGALGFSWDEENRLVSVADGSGEIGSYGFDGNNLRTTKSTASETEYFFYDLNGNVLAKLSANGLILEEYVYLNEERLAFFEYSYGSADLQQVISALQIVSGIPNSVAQDVTGDSLIGLEDVIQPLVDSAAGNDNQLYYLTNDHLGTAQIITDSTGQVVWQGEYQPFGGVNVVVNTIENNFRLPGQYYDSETGLHYNRNRFYDPSTGRYISTDPIGLTGGMNLYVYVQGDPVNWVDPWGLYSLGYARRSLVKRGVSPAIILEGQPNAYSKTQIFEEWLRLELKDQSWLDELTPCPQTLDECTLDEWHEPNEKVSQKYHPKGAYEVRSLTTEGNHSNQCIYDRNGKLMREIPSAGTADFRPCPNPPFCSDHYFHDVRPFEWGVELDRVKDYYKARPSWNENLK